MRKHSKTKSIFKSLKKKCKKKNAKCGLIYSQEFHLKNEDGLDKIHKYTCYEPTGQSLKYNFEMDKDIKYLVISSQEIDDFNRWTVLRYLYENDAAAWTEVIVQNDVIKIDKEKKDKEAKFYLIGCDKTKFNPGIQEHLLTYDDLKDDLNIKYVLQFISDDRTSSGEQLFAAKCIINGAIHLDLSNSIDIDETTQREETDEFLEMIKKEIDSKSFDSSTQESLDDQKDSNSTIKNTDNSTQETLNIENIYKEADYSKQGLCFEDYFSYNATHVISPEKNSSTIKLINQSELCYINRKIKLMEQENKANECLSKYPQNAWTDAMIQELKQKIQLSETNYSLTTETDKVKDLTNNWKEHISSHFENQYQNFYKTITRT